MRKVLGFMLMILLPLTLSGCQSLGGERSEGTATTADLDREVDSALASLYETSPEAKALSARAKGILVFPNVLKAGFIGGASYGKGALRVRGRTAGYYNTVSASYGLQAGIQKFGYALFLMDQAALNYLNNSEGWELGVGPSIVVVDAGAARSLTTTTTREGIYAFFFNQRGLMAGLGLQGSKITKVRP